MAVHYLYEGNSGDEVLDLKAQLRSLGFLNATEAQNNRFNYSTKTAVMGFQKSFGLSQDGIVGPSTEAILKRVGNYTQGIDVSIYQGSINWQKVALTDIKFAFARVSDGVNKDSYFNKNWQGMWEVGLLRGAYQFFRASQNIKQQADILLNAVDHTFGSNDLPPVIDVETNSKGLSPEHYEEQLHTWLSYVEDALKVKPIIYTGANFWNTAIKDTDEYKNYPLWVANYERASPILPQPWTNWNIWQYYTRSVEGIKGATDADFFKGSLKDLKAFVVAQKINN